jgi:hypothetical protein
MLDPREILTPLIRSAGVNATARQIGIAQASLSEWLGGRDGAIGDPKLDEIAQLFGFSLVRGLVKNSRKKQIK